MVIIAIISIILGIYVVIYFCIQCFSNTHAVYRRVEIKIYETIILRLPVVLIM